MKTINKSGKSGTISKSARFGLKPINKNPALLEMVPALDLQAEYREIESELTPRLLHVLKSGRYILGKEVEEFEAGFARFIGTKYAVGLASGSDALLLGLMALDIKPGDEMITSPFSFIATAGAIARLGAKPVFADIDPETFNLNPSLIKGKIGSKTRGILPVHLFGNPCPMDEIMRIAKEHGLFVIEDGAQAAGAACGGKQVGSFGEVGVFSFYPTKTMGAMGDAGAVTTNRADLYEKIKSLHIHGEASRMEPYRHVSIGINSRLDEIQAAVLNVKLKRLKKWNELRRKIAEKYNQAFQSVIPAKAGISAKKRGEIRQDGLRLLCGEQRSLDPRVRGDDKRNVPRNDERFVLPTETPNGCSVFHQYSIQTNRRDELQRHLRDRGIQTGVYYPIPLHLQPCFQYLGYRTGDFPAAEQLSREILSLPIYPQLKPSHQNKVIEVINRLFS